MVTTEFQQFSGVVKVLVFLQRFTENFNLSLIQRVIQQGVEVNTVGVTSQNNGAVLARKCKTGLQSAPAGNNLELYQIGSRR